MKWFYITLIVTSILLIIIGLLVGLIYRRVIRKVYTLAEDNPEIVLKEQRLAPLKRKVVFLGDSLTRANISKSFIEEVKEQLGTKHYQFINAGINSELTYHLLSRLSQIKQLQPDFIIILIGTNDVNWEYYTRHHKRLWKRLRLPEEPTKESYKKNLLNIVQELKATTKAKIALCSLPVLGEQETHPAFNETINYSKIIEEIAKEEGLNYLPVNEEMISYLKNNPKQPRYDYSKRLVERAIFRKFLLKQDLDKISEKYGFQLLTDQIHLNSKGAKIVANLVSNFIKNN